jgi:hypothetical protein
MIWIFLIFALVTLANYFVKREKRIRRVVSLYLADIGAPRYNGLYCLYVSGALNLKNRFEVKSVCLRIVNACKTHPNFLYPNLPNARILGFIKFCHEKGLSIKRGSDASFSLGIWVGQFPEVLDRKRPQWFNPKCSSVKDNKERMPLNCESLGANYYGKDSFTTEPQPPDSDFKPRN